ncbi:secreted RxLR effector protein 161-like [Bidens hawaiensis]|uniref:secreted RxLR effector protein 161-like n=1 Tax=Bidens hawaiensis TaxID=980011 RepID=UPI004049D56B
MLLVLSQRKYTLDILEDCGLQGCCPSSFPIPNLKHDKGENESKVDSNRYRRIVGRLLYFQATILDITYAVNILSQFVADLRQNHLDAARRVLRYLEATSGQGILLPRDGGYHLSAYYDAVWLSCPFTRRSRTRYLLLLGGAPVSWKTMKQAVVSRSSIEEKYRFMASTISEVLWVCWLLRTLDALFDEPIPVFCDNQADGILLTIQFSMKEPIMWKWIAILLENGLKVSTSVPSMLIRSCKLLIFSRKDW